MAVGDIERAVEGLVNRGIGTSGLTQRLVGQMNIEELRDLNSAIAESRATMANQEESRRASLVSQFLKERQAIVSGGGSTKRIGGTFDPNQTGALVSVVPGSATTGTPTMFKLAFIDAGNQRREVSFQSIDALNEALRNPAFQGVQPVLEGIPTGLPSEQLTRLQESPILQNLNPLAVQQVRESIFGKGGRGITGTTFFGPSGANTPQFTTPKQAEDAIRSGDVKFQDLDTNMKARILSGQLNKDMAAIKLNPNDLQAKAQIQAIREGKGQAYLTARYNAQKGKQ